ADLQNLQLQFFFKVEFYDGAQESIQPTETAGQYRNVQELEVLCFDDYRSDSDNVDDAFVMGIAPPTNTTEEAIDVARKDDSIEQQVTKFDGNQTDTLALFNCIENFEDCVESVIREITGDGSKSTACDELTELFQTYDEQIAENTKVDSIQLTDEWSQEFDVTSYDKGAVEYEKASLEEFLQQDPIESLESPSILETSTNDIGDVPAAYVVFQDPNNPLNFRVCEKETSNELDADIQISVGSQLHTLKSCSVKLTNCLFKPQQSNPLESITFCVDDPPEHESKKPKMSDVTAQSEVNVGGKRPIKGKNQSTINTSAKSKPLHSSEQKIASINEWLQASSQNQQDDHVVNGILHDASLTSLADIESLQLATYMESIEQTPSMPILDLPDGTNSSETIPAPADNHSSLEVSTDEPNTSTNRCCEQPIGDISNISAKEKNSAEIVVEDSCVELKVVKSIEEAEDTQDSCITVSSQKTSETLMKKQANSQSFDWKAFDNYSTDLDYEPSETSESEEEEDEEIPRSSNAEQKNPIDGVESKSASTETPVSLANNVSECRVLMKMIETFTSKSHKTSPINIVRPLRQEVNNTRCLSLDLLERASDDSEDLLRKQILFLFSRACIDHMKKEVCRIKCPYTHCLPPEHVVFDKMMLFPSDALKKIYEEFIVKNEIPFVKYFPIVAEAFGKKKMELSLLAAIKHCENHNQINYFKYIFRGMISIGWPRRKALKIITDCCQKCSTACNTILDIILNTDPLTLIDLLRNYCKNANIQDHHMTIFLHKICVNPAPSLLPVFVDMLERYSESNNHDAGTLKMMLFQCKRLVAGNDNLIRRLNHITMRVD
ncbi:hypothetical protein Bhyg_13331, partial [Pseudolycoriella hygida]